MMAKSTALFSTCRRSVSDWACSAKLRRRFNWLITCRASVRSAKRCPTVSPSGRGRVSSTHSVPSGIPSGVSNNSPA